MKRLSQEIGEMSERNAKLGTEKLDLQRKVNELETSVMQTQFEATRLAREKQHLEQQFQWASNELDAKASEVAEVRKEKATQVMTLRLQLDEALEARKVAEEQLNVTKARSAELEKQKNLVRQRYALHSIVPQKLISILSSRRPTSRRRRAMSSRCSRSSSVARWRPRTV